MPKERKNVVEKEMPMEKIIVQGRCPQTRLIQSQPYQPTALLHAHQLPEAHAVEMIETTPHLQLRPSLEREDTVIPQTAILLPLTRRGLDTDPDLESGLKTGTFVDDVGKAVRSSVEESVTRKFRTLPETGVLETRRAHARLKNVAQ